MAPHRASCAAAAFRARLTRVSAGRQRESA